MFYGGMVTAIDQMGNPRRWRSHAQEGRDQKGPIQASALCANGATLDSQSGKMSRR